MRTYFVYIMANDARVLHVGVTNDLARRVREHKAATGSAFTARYRVHKLVHFEQTNDPRIAISREKQLKRWPRARKRRLFEIENPDWRDLSSEL